MTAACAPHLPAPQQRVLTVIAAPASSRLDETLITAASAQLRTLRCEVAAAEWLSPGEAVDIPFIGTVVSEAAEEALRSSLCDWTLDLAIQPAEGRRKAVLVADMDSTIVTGETLDELAGRLDLKEKIAAITARAMNGEIDFATALRERVAMLKGLTIDALGETLAEVTLTGGAKTLVATMSEGGATTALVSGGFTAFAEPVAKLCGFEEVRANRLALAEGRLTGEVIPPILDQAVKLETLESLAQIKGVRLDSCLSVGDGANDLPMIQAAGLGVAFHAKPRVRAGARFRIDHADLTALLFLQGYRRSEFVTA